jgi:transposase
MGRRTFSAEFKLEAIKLVRERGMTIHQAAQDLGLHHNVLRRWVANHAQQGEKAFPGRGKQRPDDAELSRLRRELAKTRAERDILKKAIAFFAKEPR